MGSDFDFVDTDFNGSPLIAGRDIYSGSAPTQVAKLRVVRAEQFVASNFKVQLFLDGYRFGSLWTDQEMTVTIAAGQHVFEAKAPRPFFNIAKAQLVFWVHPKRAARIDVAARFMPFGGYWTATLIDS